MHREPEKIVCRLIKKGAGNCLAETAIGAGNQDHALSHDGKPVYPGTGLRLSPGHPAQTILQDGFVGRQHVRRSIMAQRAAHDAAVGMLDDPDHRISFARAWLLARGEDFHGSAFRICFEVV